MKKTLTAMILLAGAASLYSQGFVSMNDYNGGNSGFQIQVFQAQPLAASSNYVSTGTGFNQSGYEVMGQPANSYLAHPGSTVYATGRSTIGPGYSVGLLALDGGGATSYSQLSPAYSLPVNSWFNNFGSSPVNNNYGIWNFQGSAFIPGTASVASVAVAVWQNTGPAGAATTLATAQADGYEWGVSNIETANVATGVEPPGFLPSTITSFSLVTEIPEPGTLALGLTGGLSFLLCKRKRR